MTINIKVKYEQLERRTHEWVLACLEVKRFFTLKCYLLTLELTHGKHLRDKLLHRHIFFPLNFLPLFFKISFSSRIYLDTIHFVFFVHFLKDGLKCFCNLYSSCIVLQGITIFKLISALSTQHFQISM